MHGFLSEDVEYNAHFFSKKYLSYTEQTSVSTSIKDEALEKNCGEGENVG